MRPFLVVADLDKPTAEPFMVLSVDPTKRVDGGCKAIVMSLHWTREEAEAAIAAADSDSTS
ncbi:hypothetical protein [Croceicoccus mobilis]|uniref:Uncharacterized protein n=1 Tax=Croceicoccus mobilis TaxID=1703339 RepID=A0A916YSG2_9SPHN|nr:hypothetical protein [Croceicoccus mobilis]GGD58661.1 hypothetical protein GCM10010990_04920 [Croceicoccus mobilis]